VLVKEGEAKRKPRKPEFFFFSSSCAAILLARRIRYLLKEKFSLFISSAHNLIPISLRFVYLYFSWYLFLANQMKSRHFNWILNKYSQLPVIKPVSEKIPIKEFFTPRNANIKTKYKNIKFLRFLDTIDSSSLIFLKSLAKPLKKDLIDKKIEIKLFYKWDLLCFESILQYLDFITPFIFIIMLLIKLRLRLEYLKSRHKSGSTNNIYFTSFEFSRTILFGHRKELFMIAWIISNHYD